MRQSLIAGMLSLAVFVAAPLSLPSAAVHASESESDLVKPNRYGLPDFGDLIDEVGPAVVNISVVHTRNVDERAQLPDDPMFDLLRRFGFPMPEMMPGPHSRGPRISQGIGSGFIISEDGYVLTNAHVVEERGADAEVTVRLSDRREFEAEVVGVDPRTDIAVLKIEADDLPTVTMGDPEDARVGEWVVAVGSPFGFDHTVTAGIISAKARRLPSENYVPFIQTDVAINPGNSGGPLFNLAGEVIGINAQIYSRSGGFMGISFAIPIDVAIGVKDQLVEHGRVQRGKLGVTIQAVDSDLADNFGLPEPKGALVSNVEPDSAADAAGMQPGDVVLAVNGVEVSESADLPRLIGERRPGSEVQLELWRDGKRIEVEAVLDELQPERTAAASERAEGSRSESVDSRLGLSARALTQDERERLGVSGGLIVEQVSGPAARAELRRGDVILALNNRPVRNLEQFRELIDAAGNRFALLVQRGNGRIFVPISLE